MNSSRVLCEADGYKRILCIQRICHDGNRRLCHLVVTLDAHFQKQRRALRAATRCVCDFALHPANCGRSRRGRSPPDRFWDAAFAAAWMASPPGSPAFNAALSQFTDAKTRELQGDGWEAISRSIVGQTHSDYAAHMGNPTFDKTMRQLQTIPEFRRLYAANEIISSTQEMTRTIFHPELGPIDIVTVDFLIPGTALTVTIELPQGDGMARLRKHLSEKTS